MAGAALISGFIVPSTQRVADLAAARRRSFHRSYACSALGNQVLAKTEHVIWRGVFLLVAADGLSARLVRIAGALGSRHRRSGWLLSLRRRCGSTSTA
ncbi:MAG: hypothetical protein R3C58_03600 [Parvularculaceae bacterium]